MTALDSLLKPLVDPGAGHLLVSGPTGSGKSTLCRALLDDALERRESQAHVLASGRDWEAWAERHAAAGRNVTIVRGESLRLAPFLAVDVLLQEHDDAGVFDPGNMLVAMAWLMLTLHFPECELNRAHRRDVHEALASAAKATASLERVCRTQDVLDALLSGPLSSHPLSQALERFCSGPLGDIFNAPEVPSNPWDTDSDIVLVDPSGLPGLNGVQHEALQVLIGALMVMGVSHLGAKDLVYGQDPRYRLQVIDTPSPILNGMDRVTSNIATSMLSYHLIVGRQRGHHIWLSTFERASLGRGQTIARCLDRFGCYVGLSMQDAAWLDVELHQLAVEGPVISDAGARVLRHCLAENREASLGEPRFGTAIWRDGTPRDPFAFPQPPAEEA